MVMPLVGELLLVGVPWHRRGSTHTPNQIAPTTGVHSPNGGGVRGAGSHHLQPFSTSGTYLPIPFTFLQKLKRPVALPAYFVACGLSFGVGGGWGFGKKKTWGKLQLAGDNPFYPGFSSHIGSPSRPAPLSEQRLGGGYFGAPGSPRFSLCPRCSQQNPGLKPCPPQQESGARRWAHFLKEI